MLNQYGVARKLTLDNQKIFEAYITLLGNTLELENRRTEEFYTPHGLTHIQDVLKVIDMLFESCDFKYSNEELLCLCIAAFCHDIAMGFPQVNRKQHSRQAKETLISEFFSDKKLSVLNPFSDMQLHAITEIMVGHSDHENCARFSALKDIKPSIDGTGPIRAQLLSAILRIADEMDVCCNRLNNIPYDHLKDSPDQALRNSYFHWRTNDMLTFPKIGADYTVILYTVKPSKFLYAGKDPVGEWKNEQHLVENAINKISKEIAGVDALVFSKQNELRWRLKKADYTFDPDDHDLVLTHQENVPTIDENLNSKIEELVFQYKYFDFSHKSINRNLCLRDWIDLDAAFSNDLIVHLMRESIVKYVNETFDNVQLVGIGKHGALLASTVGAITNNDFTYYFDKDSLVTPAEKNTDFKSNVVLITDLVLTGKTIYSAIRAIENDSNSKVKGVISCFYRRLRSQEKGYSYVSSVLSKTNFVCLNNSFVAESCGTMNDCIFFKNNNPSCGRRTSHENT